MVVVAAHIPSTLWLLVHWAQQMSVQACLRVRDFSQEAEGCLAHLPLG